MCAALDGPTTDISTFHFQIKTQKLRSRTDEILDHMQTASAVIQLKTNKDSTLEEIDGVKIPVYQAETE
jgi:hypothetical protein